VWHARGAFAIGPRRPFFFGGLLVQVVVALAGAGAGAFVCGRRRRARDLNEQ
jgi:hypothetical protein